MTEGLAHLDYIAVVILFAIGLYVVLTKQNLIKKIIGLNIMETAVFGLIVTSGMVDGGSPPLLGQGLEPPYASPIAHALVLTGIVVALSVTALALVLILRVKAECGSIELDELLEPDE